MRVLLASLCAGLLLAACGSTGSSPPQSPSASPTPSGVTSVSLRLEPQQVRVHEAGRDKDHQYGWVVYTGEAEFDGQDCEAEMLASIDYVDLQGSFEGMVRLRCPKGELGLRMTGVGRLADKGTVVSGDLEIIGGTRQYAEQAGRGRFAGVRGGPIGTPIELDVTLYLLQPAR